MLEVKNNLWRTSILCFFSFLLFLFVFSAVGNTQDIETKVDDYIKVHIEFEDFEILGKD